MPLVFAAVANHAPGITARRGLATREQSEVFFGAYGNLRARLEAAKLDALIVVTAEHFANFFMDNMPAFCIGLAESYAGPVEDEAFLKIPRTRVPGAPGLARRIAAAVAVDVDLSHSEELVFDHGVMVPLHLLTPNIDLPVIPIIQNCLAPPLPHLERCYSLGKALRRATDAQPERVGILGAGGISHWPAAPRSGEINEGFDRGFMDAFLANRRADMTRYSDAELEALAGPGGHEIRSWITVAAATEEVAGEELCLVPIPAYAVSGAIAVKSPSSP